MTTYGPHLMGDLKGCDPKKMRDGEFVYRFLNDLVKVIGLQPIGSPHIDFYTGPHSEWEGASATIHIQTSHITAHFFKFGYVFIDIFSCKPFHQSRAIDFVTHRLNVTGDTHWHSMERGENFPSELLDPQQREATA